MPILVPGGISQIVLAMPHRGRLSVLTGLLGYDPAALFHKINDGAEIYVEGEQFSGDILYHQRTLNIRTMIILILMILSHQRDLTH